MHVGRSAGTRLSPFGARAFPSDVTTLRDQNDGRLVVEWNRCVLSLSTVG
jgi:hypothetical protein